MADDSADKLDASQVEEISDYLLSGLVRCVQGLVLTMAASPYDWKPTNQPPAPAPDTFVSMVPQPPAPPTDVPDGPGGNPTPSGGAPEPGTLVAGLSGMGVFLYRYYRQRKRPVPKMEPEASTEPMADVEMAGV